MPELLKRAHQHRGASFVEILQNCNVFNDKVFSHITDKSVAPEKQIHLEHGKPLRFGADNTKGLRVRPGTLELEVVMVGKQGVTEEDLLMHDETNRTLASLLAAMDPPTFPVALGVLYCDPAPTYGEGMRDQMEGVGDPGSLNDLLRQGRTWTVLG